MAFYKRRVIQERNREMSQAWHTALFSRAEKMPKLSNYLIGDGVRKQTPKQQAQAWIALAAAVGGTWKPHDPNDPSRRIVR